MDLDALTLGKPCDDFSRWTRSTCLAIIKAVYGLFAQPEIE